jgi:hypothetical protein
LNQINQSNFLNVALAFVKDEATDSKNLNSALSNYLNRMVEALIIIAVAKGEE